AGRPSLSLQSTYGATRNTLLGFNDGDQAILAAQLSVPIFSGGLNQSRVRQAKHAKTRLAFLTRDTELAVDQTVRQVWAQIEAARRIVRTSERQVEASLVAFEGVTLEQQVGTRTQLDVLDAEQETLNARLTLLNAEREYDASVFELLSVIGVLDADGIDLDVEGYDADRYLRAVAYDGFKEAGDRLLPEAVQKIGGQLPDIGEDLVGFMGATVEELELDVLGEDLAKNAGQLGGILKEGVDAATVQEPMYDPRIADPDMVIVTDPYSDTPDRAPEPDDDLVIDLPDVPDSRIDEGAPTPPPVPVP
ncbi:MAG: TolC family protein, partial [Litorimonas sp.]